MKDLFLTMILFSCPSILFGQEALNKLTAPTSPAASILGIQSAAILSPKSYQTLEATLYSNFISSDMKVAIPNDFSLEFTPYWTKNHGLSVEQLLYPNSTYEQIVRNSSFSMASTQKFLLGDSTATNGIAFGCRTTLCFGNKNDRNIVKEYKSKLNESQSIRPKIGIKAFQLANKPDVISNFDFFENIQSYLTDAILKYGGYDNIEEAKKITTAIFKDAKELPDLDKSNPDKFVDEFVNIVDKNINEGKLFQEFESYIAERQGWSVDIAYAGLLNFPTNNFNYSAIPHQSLWITPTYRFKDKLSHLKLLAVLKYDWYNLGYWEKYFPKNHVYKNSFDFGLGLSGEFKKFSVQFEAVGRNSNSEIPEGKDSKGYVLFRKEQNSDFQYIGSFCYNVSDQIVLTYSFGNKFEPIQNPNNTLVSQLTLNFGFGTPTKNDLDMKK
jgi:hypothetical protein